MSYERQSGIGDKPYRRRAFLDRQELFGLGAGLGNCSELHGTTFCEIFASLKISSANSYRVAEPSLVT